MIQNLLITLVSTLIEQGDFKGASITAASESSFFPAGMSFAKWTFKGVGQVYITPEQSGM